MMQSRMGRIALTAVAIFVVWGVAAVIFLRIGRRKPPTKTATPPPKRFDFTSWPTPDLALVITGQQLGYLEPCGCTEGQKGGIGRRHNLINRLEDRGWPVGKVDLGGLIYRSGRQAELKFQTALAALQILGYQSLGLGLGDVNLPAGSLFSEVTSEPVRVPIISANLSIFGTESPKYPPSHHVFEAGGIEVGVAAVFGEKHLNEKQNDEIKWSAPAEALQTVVEPLKDAGLRILLSYGPIDETEALAEQFADFEIVVTAGGAEEPADPKPFGEDRLLVETGEKGKSVILVAFYRDSEMRFRSELIPLDSRFRDTPEWEEQLAHYVSMLKDEQLVELTKRQRHPDGAEFVGASTCGKCHTSAYTVWESTKHALATQVLEPKDRHYDPECIRCHATGWDPQHVIPWESGYVSKEATPHLVGNGCENCHGPGSNHVEAEQASLTGQAPGNLGELRSQMRVDLEYAEKNLCISCHDADNSHDYEFETYWPKVVHRGVK